MLDRRFDLSARLEGLTISELDVLNLGAGHCSSPISEQFKQLPFRSLTNVEVWLPYLLELNTIQFQAAKVANINSEVLKYVTNQLPNSFDVVIILDVLEHFDKADGLFVMDRALEIARQRLVVFGPVGPCPQDDIDGNPWQRHLSTWWLDDFRGAELVEWYQEFHTHVKPPADAAWVTFNVKVS